MKRILCAIILVLMLTSCKPISPQDNTFAGTWTTNLGKVEFQQTGNNITGSIEGYGGWHKYPIEGTVTANNEATFHTTWLGDFTLTLAADTFSSKSDEIVLCGIRSDISEVLPTGCGFSGKWNLPSNSTFPNGSYMILTQVGVNVAGDFYDGDDKVYDSITGKVEWGKGRHMEGTSKQHGSLTFSINENETGFAIDYGKPKVEQQLCAIRDGHTSATIIHIYKFICQL